MNTTISRGLTRLVAGPVVAAGIIGGALGLAAVANANTVSISPQTPNATYTAAVSEQTGNGKWYYPTDAVQVGTRDAGPTQAVQTQPMQPRIDTGPTQAVQTPARMVGV